MLARGALHFGLRYPSIRGQTAIPSRYFCDSKPKEIKKKAFRKEKSIQSFSKYVEIKNKHKDGYKEPLMGPYRCLGINIGLSISLKDVYATLKKDYHITCFLDQHREFEVLHIQYQQKLTADSETVPALYGAIHGEKESNVYKILKSKDAFIFKEGSLVCWGMDTHEEESWIEQVKKFSPQPTTNAIIEEMNVYRGHNTTINSDNIILSAHSSPKLHQREMLAYSFGIGRSIFLENIEDEIGRGKDSIMKRVLATPAIIKQGKLPSRDEWTRITGEQMELKCRLNLNSSLLDVPDLFWEDYDMGILFQEMQENLEIPDRIATLNTRLDMIEQIIATVQSSLTDKYSHKLEVIIIVLIAIEVIFYLADKNTYWKNLRFKFSYPFVDDAHSK